MQAHFYPDEHQPPLRHEFQFDLDHTDGLTVLDRTVAWLENRLSVAD